MLLSSVLGIDLFGPTQIFSSITGIVALNFPFTYWLVNGHEKLQINIKYASSHNWLAFKYTHVSIDFTCLYTLLGTEYYFSIFCGSLFGFTYLSTFKRSIVLCPTDLSFRYGAINFTVDAVLNFGCEMFWFWCNVNRSRFHCVIWEERKNKQTEIIIEREKERMWIMQNE